MRVLRIPVIALKWLLAVLAALAWLTVVPIVDLLRDAVGRLWRGVSQLR